MSGKKTGRIETENRLRVFYKLSMIEDDLIQDYIDGDLTPEEKRAFEKHFLRNDEGRKKLARPLRRYADAQPTAAPPPTVSRSWLSGSFRYLLPAAALVLVLGLLFAGWFFLLRTTLNQRTTAALDSAYANGRPLESRITDLKYAPFDTVRGDNKEADEPDRIKLANLELLDEVVKRPDAANIHALGRFYLAKKDLDAAVAQLERARGLAPQNAPILSDLGTAYLEKSNLLPSDQGGQQLKMRAMALEEFEKTVEIDPRVPEAHFNKALCLKLMGLPLQARQVWDEYIKLDPASKWAEEARENIRKLEENRPQTKTPDELLQDFMTAFRTRDDDNAYRILANYREMTSGRFVAPRIARLAMTTSEAATKTEYLAALEYIGRLENERSGDPFFAEMAKFYSTLPTPKQVALGAAHDSLFKGYDLLKTDALSAHNEFKAVRSAFEKDGDKWNAAIATFWIGYTLNRNGKISESNTLLLSAAENHKGYKWLSSHYFGWLVHNMLATRKFSKALEYNEKALGLSQGITDLVLTQRGYSQRAEVYHYVGQYDRSLENIQKAIQIGGSFDSNAAQKWRDLDSAVMLFFAIKFYRVSAAYEGEALAIATNELNDNKTFAYQSITRLGQIHGALGKYEDSFEFFDQGIAIGEALADEPMRMRSVAFAKLGRGRIYRESGDCVNALKDFDDSLKFFDTGKFSIFQYEAHKGRLRCYLENRDDAAFQNEFPIILGLFRDYRVNIIEERNRNSFFDNEQDIYDIAIDYEFGRANYETSFDYAEESRARSLLDMLTSPVDIDRDGANPEIKFSAAVTEPKKLNEMLPQIPANVQIVQYSVLEDKTLIWLITREGFSVVSTPIRARDLREKVLDYDGMIEKHDSSDTGKIAESAKELHRLLLGPVYQKLDPAKQICIIADKILFRLPFSTLISPDTGKYFLREYLFITAPSLNIFLNLTRKAAGYERGSPESLLSIGNPSFSEENFQGLKPLESAETEAEKVAELYDRKFLLLGTDAQKGRVMTDMPNSNVIHFGGHYLVNDGSPLLSGFVLSENPNTHRREDSILTNYEILGDKLINTRLIVLAACETGVETYYAGEGMIGASRTFLAAGVPLVIASQWPVETKATTEIMVRFHRYRKTGGFTTAQALRQAQLDILEGDNKLYRDPYYWAGFTAFGGYAQF